MTETREFRYSRDEILALLVADLRRRGLVCTSDVHGSVVQGPRSAMVAVKFTVRNEHGAT